MTNTLHNPHTEAPEPDEEFDWRADFENGDGWVPVGGGDPESFSDYEQEVQNTHESLLRDTDWDLVIKSYMHTTAQEAQGVPYVDPAYTGSEVLFLIKATTLDPKDFTESDKQRLLSLVGDLYIDGYMYAREQNDRIVQDSIDTPPVPVPVIARRIDQWQQQSKRVVQYLSHERYSAYHRAAQPHYMEALLELAQHTPDDPRMAVVATRLVSNAVATMAEHDQILAPPTPSGRPPVIGNIEALRHVNVTPEQFRAWLRVALCAYPASTAQHISQVTVSKEEKRTVTSTGTEYTLGEAYPSDNRITLYVINTRDTTPALDEAELATLYTTNLQLSDRTALHQTKLSSSLEKTFDHEMAHIAHFNAPIEWLRRWDTLVQSKPINNLSTYVEINHKENRPGLPMERLAEAIQIFRHNPTQLLRQPEGGLEHFLLLQELLQTYEQVFVERVINHLRDHPHNAIPDEDYRRMEQDLHESRIRILQARIQARTGEHAQPKA